MHRRALLYALLALAVPLPALALTGHADPVPAANANLSVAASLDSCGTAADTIVCKLDASWNEIPGATRYTASVTRADGSVVDFGDVGGGSSSFWVPYAGNGAYTVSVSVYGTPPGSDRPEVVARGSSSAGAGPEEDAPETTGDAATSAGSAASAGAASSGDGATSEPAGGDSPDTEPPDDPACEEDPPPEDPPAEESGPEEPADSTAPGTDSQALSGDAEAALDESAELPDSVECPATSTAR